MQMGLGLYAWSLGTAKQFVEVLNHSNLISSTGTIVSMLERLATRSVEEVIELLDRLPHALAYDNFNISLSEHIEQRPDEPAKVQNGTFIIVYPITGIPRSHFELEPMLEKLKNALPLRLDETEPTMEEQDSFIEQTTLNIVDVLVKYCPQFVEIGSDISLQHPPRRRLHPDARVSSHPIRMAPIEEASTEGQIRVQDNIYIEQLKQKATPERSERLSKYAIPLIVDQLTLARTRGAVARRRGDLDPWQRREVFQLATGAFHFLMNLLWAILHTHRGSIHQMGSLASFFSVLDKARLAREKPDYHTLLMAYDQILDGFLLNCWRQTCGFDSLDEFAASNPTPEDLRSMADKIRTSYVHRYYTREERKTFDPTKDIAYFNVQLLIRDLLYVRELRCAVQDGDFGRMEDMYPDLCRIFRGAGSHNYSTEILHWMHNVKRVWTPEFAYVLPESTDPTVTLLMNSTILGMSCETTLSSRSTAAPCP